MCMYQPRRCCIDDVDKDKDRCRFYIRLTFLSVKIDLCICLLPEGEKRRRNLNATSNNNDDEKKGRPSHQIQTAGGCISLQIRIPSNCRGFGKLVVATIAVICTPVTYRLAWSEIGAGLLITVTYFISQAYWLAIYTVILMIFFCRAL
ncbi:hypothetical protein NC652_040090 [Populus alba x Populus x berolinensis]|nr:hypothetical protein NC652_040090 [Populus alba x Populus x berolinensis]